MNRILKLMSFVAAVAVLQAVLPPKASALAVGAFGGKKRLQRTLDGNGLPIVIAGDMGWKVFEIPAGTTLALVVDELGVTPTQGIVRSFCAESGTSGTAQNEWVVLFNSTSITTSPALNANTSARRLYPPLSRATQTERCSPDIYALFNAGLVIGQTVTSELGTKTGYVYWRPLGSSN